MDLDLDLDLDKEGGRRGRVGSLPIYLPYRASSWRGRYVLPYQVR